MINPLNTEKEHQYWEKRYEEGRTGWDMGSVSPPIKEYVDQLENKALRILIPGAGNAYEAEYLWRQGFSQVYVLDIAHQPLAQLKARVPDFPESHLIQANFFEHQGQYDLILEQTFFCSFPPTTENRKAYAQQMANLLHPNGKLVGVWFDFPKTQNGGNRPFGGSKTEYLIYFAPYFKMRTFSRCYNSIKPRGGKELFGIFEKK